MTNIMYCGCTNGGSGMKYQDEKYGVGMRVVTHSSKGEARCTVCGGTPRGYSVQKSTSGKKGK